MKKVFQFLTIVIILSLVIFPSETQGKSKARKGIKAAAGNEEKKPEIIIFPVEPGRPRAYKPAEKVLTGVFSGSGKKESAVMNKDENKPTEGSSEAKKTVSRKKTADSIAWVTKDGLRYHDILLNLCASETEMIWINDRSVLCGLEPCPECFIKTSHVPEFIKIESGGLELATAGVLLDNSQFIKWLVERIPVKNPSFLSTRKLLIYPALEVTENGLKQLVREVELAYRRHTWKVIEVVGKMNELDTNVISSFNHEDQQ